MSEEKNSYLTHLQREIKKVSDSAVAVADEMETAFKANGEIPSELKEKFDKITADGAAMREEIEKINGMKAMVDFVNAPDGKRGEEIEEKGRIISPGEMLTGHEGVKNYRKGSRVTAGVELKGIRNAREAKATFSGSGTGLTGYDRQSGIIELGQRPLTIADLFAQGTTNANTIRYMQEVSFTNAATIVAEGAQKPEATFDLIEVDAAVRKVAVTARVTDETFEDFPQVRDYINNRLMFMVEQTEENQLLNGDGTPPNIAGVLDYTIQTQAIGTDPMHEAILKAANKVRTIGFMEPDAVVIHPTDMQALQLSKDGNDQYYGGGFFTGAYGNGNFVETPRIWGMRTVVTSVIAAGDPLVGAFRAGGQVFYRGGMRIEATNSNEDDFEKNLVSIRAEQRLALAVYRPLAFCQVLTP